MRYRWLLWIALLPVICGCIRVEQTLTLEADHSGTLEIRYGMVEGAVADAEEFEEEFKSYVEREGEQYQPEDLFLPFQLEHARMQFDLVKPPGIRLVSMESESEDGWRYVRTILTFETIESLLQTPYFRDIAFSLLENQHGDYVLSMKQASGGKQLHPAIMAEIVKRFSGFRVETIIKVPGNIVETNGSQDGNIARWSFDRENDAGALQSFASSRLDVVFSGNGLDLAEIDVVTEGVMTSR